MAWRAAPSVPREAVVAAKDRWLAALALGALAFVSIHCGQHLEARHFDKLLWLSNAATALLAVGCMVRVPRLNAVALLWLSFSTLLWVFDVAHGAAIDSAVLTHVGSLVLAIVAVRLAPPTGSTWPLATFGLAVVVALSRWLGEPTHNVNLVFGFAPGWQATGVSHPAYVVALALAAVVLFVAVDAGAQRLITRNVRRDSLVA